MSESAKKSVFMRPGRLVQMSEADGEMSELKTASFMLARPQTRIKPEKIGNLLIFLFQVGA